MTKNQKVPTLLRTNTIGASYYVCVGSMIFSTSILSFSVFQKCAFSDHPGKGSSVLVLCLVVKTQFGALQTYFGECDCPTSVRITTAFLLKNWFTPVTAQRPRLFTYSLH